MFTGAGELRALPRHPKYKTELCRTYHTSGFCPYGARCHFVHNAAAPAPPPPTPRDVDASRGSVDRRAGPPARSTGCAAVTDNIQLSLLSAALDKHASASARAPAPVNIAFYWSTTHARAILNY